jgi:hypothetical protein
MELKTAHWMQITPPIDASVDEEYFKECRFTKSSRFRKSCIPH